MTTNQTPEIAIALIKETKNKKLKSLDLGRCGLKEIPEELFEMTWLEELNLGNFIWDDVEKKMKECKNKGPLNFLSKLPNDLYRLKNLKFLRISGFHEFGLSNWDIETIPTKTLPVSLVYLDLSYNQITEIKGLDKLSGLTSLNLSDNQITEIKGLDKLSGLTSLNLSDNQITEIKGLDKLSGLTSIALSGNQITEIKGLDKLSGLTSIALSGNQITEIKGLDKLSGLTSLDLDSNQITEIKGLDKLSGLTSLDLDSNQITEIKGLDKLSGLTSLDLA
ncbi:MAG: leucine-rich repeat domain-containing protein, partial [Chitinophagaceae bacterium]|nr:leucine-rich repeat domain-containing protein [Chitinophagaceae bacterium]